MKQGRHASVAAKSQFWKAALAIVLAAALAIVFPMTAKAAMPAPSYGWYMSSAGTQADPYVISNPREWVGFANLVNGMADIDDDEATAAVQDSFDGKYVELGGNLLFRGAELEPVGGGAYGTSFDGSFDGKGYSINSYTIAVSLVGADAVGATECIGLFGKTGTASSISNVTVADATIAVSITAGDGDAAVPAQQAIRYVGALAGFAGGPINNCASDNCTVNVENEMDQTADILLPIQWVGGMAGAVQGDLVGCASSATVNVSEPGNPDADAEQSTIVFGVGGLAGYVGSPDSSVDSATSRIEARISDCSFCGTLNIDTPSENGIDRFGNQIYALACTAGGIAGYTRGDVSNCTNSGTFVAPHTTALGGIVGSLRGQFQGSNFVDEGSDDGMVEGASALTLSGCFNTGSMHGWANVAGIVGRAGTNTTVTSCFNGLSADGAVTTNYVLAGRSTKPFPAGIASSVYGKVSYCANFGEVASIANQYSVNLATGQYTTGGGYYAAGIAGILQYYTDANGARSQEMSEIYGCYNAGPIRANSLMRQRALVGDNEGYVHDCLAVSGLVENDDMFYVESDNGTNANCYVISASDLKNNTAITIDDKGTENDASDDATAYPIAILNAQAAVDGWVDYWTVSQCNLNNGYPVVDNQVTWDAIDIASADVSLAANAEYSGLASIPRANVVLQGQALIQDVDFRVEPQADAIQITAEGETPYMANIVGIGAYTGSAQQLAYGMGKGNMANCSVLVDPTDFNWEGQLPSAAEVHVTSPSGAVVDPDEYTFALDTEDAKLTDGAAVNAGIYTLVVSAREDSEHFFGSAVGEYTIAKIKIIGGGPDADDSDAATARTISYLGETYDWQSTGDSAANPTDEENLLELAYTGHSIKPAVTSVTYLGHELAEGVDYRVVYGQATMDGDVDDTPNTEVGDGWIIVRFVAGSNFTNYDLMHFKIVERTGAMDISKGEAVCPAEVVYEPGDAGYEPVTVTYGGSELTEGTDYTIEYANNNELGTASYIVTGIGEFTGALTGTFELVEGEAYTILYEYDEDTLKATVVGVEYNGIRDSFNLAIPETTEYEGKTYTVTAVGEKACGGAVAADFLSSAANLSKRKIASVTIPATVTMIDNNAFGSNANGYAMTQLASVTFAEGSQLQTIGQQAFANTGLTEIVIPAGVTTIGNAAFKDSSSIVKAIFLTKSADLPTMVLTNSAQNSFRNVKTVEAFGFAAAEKAQSNVAAMNALSGYTWNWNELEDDESDVPAIWGDANGDGNVNSTDALYVLRYSTGRLAADRIDLVAANVNGDDKVNSTDALYILRRSTGRIDHFPTENQ